MKPQIPYAQTTRWGRELEYATEAIASNWVGSGSYLPRFEHMIATTIGVEHAIAVCNGTAALHASYLALGLKAGDEVVIPAFCYLAGANVALQLGLTPVFVDVDPNTFCITAENISTGLTSRTRAVLVVHSYGAVCDMDSILGLCESRNIHCIEDSAEAFGSARSGYRAGSKGVLGTVSFHAAKTVSTGEGGAILTNDSSIAESLRQFRSHGSLRERYFHDLPGHNFRLTNLQAALGCAQLEAWEQIVKGRKRVHRLYQRALARIEGVSLQEISPQESPVIWAVALRIDVREKGRNLSRILARLKKSGIEARNGFRCASEHTIYGSMRFPTPISDDLARTVLSLPTYPSLTESDVEYVASQLEMALDE